MSDQTVSPKAESFAEYGKIAGNLASWIQHHAEHHGYDLDGAQRATLSHFQRLNSELIGSARKSLSLFRLKGKRKKIRGIYLFGGVGRGKSFLMDSFFLGTAVADKKRVHFHRFMQEIHHQLRDLQGQTDPVKIVASNIAKDIRLLCLDEFHVTDIADAMLMRRLLESLFAFGVTLVTTSNQQPDNLYLHGLQRTEFVPAIEMLKQNLEVINVDAGIDYRLRALEKVEIYHAPLDEAAERNLASAFSSIARHEGEEDNVLEIETRNIKAQRNGQGVAWFEFEELCAGPRGQADYIELARRYHTVLLSGLPQFTDSDLDKLRRFVWLIDEFYDRRVKLIVSAQVAIEQLYPGSTGGEFERTLSRLHEMQSHRYLGEPHLA